MRKDGLTCRIGACPSYNGNFHVTIYKFTTGKYKNDANVLQCPELNITILIKIYCTTFGFICNML